ncbi:hypothetical protein DDE05_38000 [Streptomyces cavourensis]|nr:hypothetical protein DDE05_38000 [Streptomyces cavourensis]
MFLGGGLLRQFIVVCPQLPKLDMDFFSQLGTGAFPCKAIFDLYFFHVLTISYTRHSLRKEGCFSKYVLDIRLGRAPQLLIWIDVETYEHLTPVFAILHAKDTGTLYRKRLQQVFGRSIFGNVKIHQHLFPGFPILHTGNTKMPDGTEPQPFAFLIF